VKWRVLIRHAAQNDLRETRDWYEKQRLGLGDEFIVAASHIDRTISVSTIFQDRKKHGHRFSRSSRFRRPRGANWNKSPPE
jgi:hypothetical protein